MIDMIGKVQPIERLAASRMRITVATAKKMSSQPYHLSGVQAISVELMEINAAEAIAMKEKMIS